MHMTAIFFRHLIKIPSENHAQIFVSLKLLQPLYLLFGSTVCAIVESAVHFQHQQPFFSARETRLFLGADTRAKRDRLCQHTFTNWRPAFRHAKAWPGLMTTPRSSLVFTHTHILPAPSCISLADHRVRIQEANSHQCGDACWRLHSFPFLSHSLLSADAVCSMLTEHPEFGLWRKR